MENNESMVPVEEALVATEKAAKNSPMRFCAVGLGSLVVLVGGFIAYKKLKKSKSSKKSIIVNPATDEATEGSETDNVMEFPNPESNE